MTETTSTVLTQEVPYNWDELKSLAAKRAEPVVRAPIPEAPTRDKVPGIPRRESPAAIVREAEKALSSSQESKPTPFTQAQKEALIADVSRKVSEQLFEEIDLVVELALKKTRAHLKADIQKAVAINVTRCVREVVEKEKAL